MAEPLTVVYLLEDTPLFGGVKVVLQQANLLARRGHRVEVVGPGRPPQWFPLEAVYRRTRGLDRDEIPAADVVVATYWTTLAPALAAARGEVAHYCQGFEGSYSHNRDAHRQIDEAYAAPIPALVVSAHLGRLLARRFARRSRVIPQPLESYWRPRRRRRPRPRPRILVPGPFEIDWKGVATALAAVAELRRRRWNCELVRLSQWPLCDAERAVIEPDEFHQHLPPRRVPELLRSCDLVLAPSWEAEGFGLPALEGMACGVPVIASDVSCYRDWATPAAVLVPVDEPAAFAAVAAEILADAGRWRRMRRAGLDVARGYRQELSADAAEDALRWVASGAWRGAR